MCSRPQIRPSLKPGQPHGPSVGLSPGRLRGRPADLSFGTSHIITNTSFTNPATFDLGGSCSWPVLSLGVLLALIRARLSREYEHGQSQSASVPLICRLYFTAAAGLWRPRSARPGRAFVPPWDEVQKSVGRRLKLGGRDNVSTSTRRGPCDDPFNSTGMTGVRLSGGSPWRAQRSTGRFVGQSKPL